MSAMAQSSYPLAGVVDEDLEEATPRGPKPKPLDWDFICAYKTFKIVRIKDRYLGMLYWFIATLVLLYIVVFAFMIEGKHQIRENGVGTIITTFYGKAFDDHNRAFDEADMRFPEIEPYGSFVMTKAVVQKEQHIGECVDYDFSCDRHETACVASGGTCEHGYCKHTAWCPSIGVSNSANSSTVSRTRIKELGGTTIELMTAINFFPGVDDRMFVAGQSPNGENPLRKLNISNLLQRAKPPLVVEDLVEKGALIGVSFFWNCDVIQPYCTEPLIVVKRLDAGKGFFQRRMRRYRVGGVDKREATILYGLRILVDSSGLGRRINLVYLVIQLGSCLALLRTASMAADFLMLRCYPKKKAEMYYKCKVIETKDYSDLQDRLNLIQERAPEMENLLTKDKFGIGPGGRGGMASVILRGRGSISPGP